MPGPLLRARVGDRLRVHFKNLDTTFKRPHSMHFHVVHYRPSSDGASLPASRARTLTCTRVRPTPTSSPPAATRSAPGPNGPSRMDTSSQSVDAAFPRLQVRDGLRSRAG